MQVSALLFHWGSYCWTRNLLVLIFIYFSFPLCCPLCFQSSPQTAARMFPGVWKPLFLRVSSWDGIPFPGRSSLPTSIVSFFVLLYFFLPVFEANDLLCWVPDVLCQHSEVVLWNLLSIEMFFWWIFEGESGVPVLFLHHLRTAPLSIIINSLHDFSVSFWSYCSA